MRNIYILHFACNCTELYTHDAHQSGQDAYVYIRTYLYTALLNSDLVINEVRVIETGVLLLEFISEGLSEAWSLGSLRTGQVVNDCMQVL